MDRTMTISDIYVFNDPTWSNLDLTGWKVEALDGEIGAVDEKTRDLGVNALIVDTGPWIFGKKVMVPAGAVSRIDEIDHRCFVNLTKDQIQHAPEFNDSLVTDRRYHDELGTYYEQHVTNRPAGPDYGADDRPLS